jgi:hypothetical protein
MNTSTIQSKLQSISKRIDSIIKEPLKKNTNHHMRAPGASNERRQSYLIHCSLSQGSSLSSNGGKQAPMRRYLQGLQGVASERLGSAVCDIRIEGDNPSMVPDSFAHSCHWLDFDRNDLLSCDTHHDGSSETLIDTSFREERWETQEHHHRVTHAPSVTMTSGTASETARQQKQRRPPPVPQRQASLQGFGLGSSGS